MFRYTLLDLQKRYHIDWDELNLWLDALNIMVYPSSDGNDRHDTIDEQEITRLDALDRHLKDGGNLEDFRGVLLPEVIPPQDLRESGQPPPSSEQLAAIPRADLSSTVTPAYPPSLAAPTPATLRQCFEFLDDCASRYWLLTSEQIAAVIGLEARAVETRTEGVASWRWQSWLFNRVGRQGRATLWHVSQLYGNEPLNSPVAQSASGLGG